MKRKDVLLLLIPTFIFVLAWMGFSIYHSFINSTISEVLNIQILPISPTFDTTTISSLKKRTHVNLIYEANPASILPGSQTQTASSSAKPNATIIDDSTKNGSTPGGTLTP